MGRRRDDRDDELGVYASPPCFMHELDPAYLGLTPEADATPNVDVMRWRKAERQRLIGARLATKSGERRGHAERIAAGLDETLDDVSAQTIGVYWPIRGEPDLRRWMARVVARGGVCALPVVVERHAPLLFRAWRPGAKLEPGVWNIPVPADGAEIIPDIVIAPVVGFDPACYRLGYGGGFYDRTLAAMTGRPRVLGVGYARAAIPTIYPRPHDIPMDVIVTEHGIVAPAGTTPGSDADEVSK